VTPEARAARERKQKIFVVVGGLFLVAMLAFQLPKLLGGSSSPQAAAAEQATTVSAQLAQTPGIANPAVSRTPAAVISKLTSFSVFALKDPFVQQVVTENGLESGSAPAEATGKGAGKAAENESTTKFSTDARGAAATIITVNGSRQVLEPGMKFPSADPLFVLVVEKPSSKSVVVGIVGGAYSGGDRTTTLKVGKPLTLVNTTTGASYKLSLVSVGSGDQAVEAAPKQ
jgi:hypothetical protein